MTHDDTPKLSPRQSTAAAALLAGATQEDAASAAGVSRSTVGRWQRQHEFRRALADGQTVIIEAAARRLVGRLAVAVDVATALLEDVTAPAAVRLSAARLLLDMAGRYHELTAIERRLSALEGWQQRQSEYKRAT